ncbi:MAG: hypothetical protein QW281_01685 [Saccharolobus sp.]
MKITETSAKYKANFGRTEVIIEESKTEKGETIYIFSSIKEVNLPNGEKWEIKTDDAKELDRNNITDDLKKNIRKFLQLL